MTRYRTNFRKGPASPKNSAFSVTIQIRSTTTREALAGNKSREPNVDRTAKNNPMGGNGTAVESSVKVMQKKVELLTKVFVGNHTSSPHFQRLGFFLLPELVSAFGIELRIGRPKKD